MVCRALILTACVLACPVPLSYSQTPSAPQASKLEIAAKLREIETDLAALEQQARAADAQQVDADAIYYTVLQPLEDILRDVDSRDLRPWRLAGRTALLPRPRMNEAYEMETAQDPELGAHAYANILRLATETDEQDESLVTLLADLRRMPGLLSAVEASKKARVDFEANRRSVADPSTPPRERGRALFELGDALEQRSLGFSDPDAAERYFQQAAALEHPTAMARHAVTLYETDAPAARAMLERSVAANDLLGIVTLAQRLDRESEDGVPTARSFELHQKAAQLGDAEAMITCAVRLVGGIGVAPDDAAARDWCRKAVAAGLPAEEVYEQVFQRTLAYDPTMPHGSVRGWLDQAKEDDVDAAGLASRYAQLLTEESAGPVRVVLLEYATQNGSLEALREIAHALQIDPERQVEARAASQRLADAGAPDGHVDLAILHLMGRGGPADEAEYRRLIQQSETLDRSATADRLDAWVEVVTGETRQTVLSDAVRLGGKGALLTASVDAFADSNYADALDFARRAVNAGSDRGHLVLAVLQAAGMEPLEQADPSAAMESVRRAVESGMDRAEAVSVVGSQLSGIGFYDEAIPFLVEAEAAGDFNSRAMLGAIYIDGTENTPSNINEGLRLLASAADAGSATAFTTLAEIYLRGVSDIEPSRSKAIEWLRKGTEAGHPEAAQHLAYAILPGEEDDAVTRTRETTVRESAALWSDAVKAYQSRGVDVPELAGGRHPVEQLHPAQQQLWLQLVIDAGDTSAITKRAEMLIDDGDTANDEQVLAALEQAKEHDLVETDLIVAAARHVPSLASDESALASLLEGMEGTGDAWSEIGYAIETLDGNGVSPTNALLVRRYYQRSHDAGAEAGTHNLARCLAVGIGGPRDEAKAAQLMQNDEDRADVFAQWGSAAESRAFETGAAADFDAAYRWRTRAVQAGGGAEIQAHLAVMKIRGRGTPKDAAGGIATLRRLADGGDATATFLLAREYLIGLVVPRDFDKYLALLKEAARLGSHEARSDAQFVYLWMDSLTPEYREWKKTMDVWLAEAQIVAEGTPGGQEVYEYDGRTTTRLHRRNVPAPDYFDAPWEAFGITGDVEMGLAFGGVGEDEVNLQRATDPQRRKFLAKDFDRDPVVIEAVLKLYQEPAAR